MSLLILATSAEIDLMKEMRTREYAATVLWLKEHAASHRVAFLECVTTSRSFIESHFPVSYAGCHDPSYRNKGANLGEALRQFFRTHPPRESLVLQITGRYHFLDRSFLGAVENHPGHDFYGRELDEFSGEGLRDHQKIYFTGCFAMGTGHFRNWVDRTDWKRLEAEGINIERSLWEYVERERLSTYHVDCVQMECNVFGNGTPDRVVF